MKLLLIVQLCTASALVVKHESSQLRPALKLRGGLAGVDAGQVATAASVLVGVNGLYCGLAPEPACKAYGMDDPAFNVAQMVKALGATNIATAILALCVLGGVDKNLAFGFAQIPWVINTLDAIFNGTGEKMGQPPFAQPLLFVISAATMYCAFTNTNMPLAVSLNAGWALLNGVPAAIMPDKLASAWGMSGDAKFEGMMKNFGYQLSALGAMSYLLANPDAGFSTIQAIGIGWLVNLLGLVDGNFVSKTIAAMGVDQNAIIFWGVVQAAVVACTLL